MVNDSFTILKYIDEVTHDIYDVADVIVIISKSIKYAYTIKDNCWMNQAYDYLQNYCFEYGGCSIMEIALRGTTHGFELYNHLEWFYENFT